MLLLACIAACVRPPPPTPPPEPAVEAPADSHGRLGTIVAIRPLAARGAEYIVREDHGATVVVVQPDTEGFAVGQRVTLQQDGRTRISRAR
ncbi:hypothetical protein [Elioraea sp.]|uniref:hypothetical protein n=1 Tax=Elioraea sp. TaxID=2185103 RepID=UPI003F72B9D7